MDEQLENLWAATFDFFRKMGLDHCLCWEFCLAERSDVTNADDRSAATTFDEMKRDRFWFFGADKFCLRMKKTCWCWPLLLKIPTYLIHLDTTFDKCLDRILSFLGHKPDPHLQRDHILRYFLRMNRYLTMIGLLWAFVCNLSQIIHLLMMLVVCFLKIRIMIIG